MRSNSFAFRLAEAMAGQGLTQQQLAERIGKTQATVSRWLGNAVPRKQTAITLAKALDVDIDWLMDGTGPKVSYGGFATVTNGMDIEKVFAASEGERLRIVRQQMEAAEKQFPSRLRWLRSHFGLSLAQLAQRCGCGVSYISRLENASRKRPSRQFVDRFVESFPGLNRSWLMWGNGAPFDVSDQVAGLKQASDADRAALKKINDDAFNTEIKRAIEAAAPKFESVDALIFAAEAIKKQTDVPPELRKALLDALSNIISRRIPRMAQLTPARNTKREKPKL